MILQRLPALKGVVNQPLRGRQRGKVMMNVNVFEIVKNVKENSYDSYGVYTRRTFESAVTSAVKDMDKMDIINLIHGYRAAKEFFEAEMTFYRYKTNRGGEVIDVRFEQTVVDCWKRANNDPTGRVVGGRRTGFGL
jgi:hypothetical protein